VVPSEGGAWYATGGSLNGWWIASSPAAMILHLKWEHVDFERGLLLLGRQQDGQESNCAERPCP
jgi:hypothetical protein